MTGGRSLAENNVVKCVQRRARRVIDNRRPGRGLVLTFTLTLHALALALALALARVALALVPRPSSFPSRAPPRPGPRPRSSLLTVLSKHVLAELMVERETLWGRGLAPSRWRGGRAPPAGQGTRCQRRRRCQRTSPRQIEPKMPPRYQTKAHNHDLAST